MSKSAFHLTSIDDTTPRIAWSPATEELHMNVVVLQPDEEIAAHINHVLDVIITCLQGSGTLTIDEEPVGLETGTIVLVPRGAERQITANNDTLVYTTVHRQRGGLMPTTSQ